MQDITAHKKALRVASLAWLKSLSTEQIEIRSKLLCEKLAQIVNPLHYKCILAYQPFSYEPQISELLKTWIELNPKLAVYLPDMKELGMKRIDSQVAASPAEIASLELIIIPGLAFTNSGIRLGHGSGWYDRFLLQCPAAHTIGLAFQEQIQPTLPIDKHDIHLQQIVSA